MMKNLLRLALLLAFTTNTATAQVNFIQNIKARNIQNLDGRWHYIIDPYETGFRGFLGAQADDNGLGGFFENKQQQSKSELIEYDFSKSPTLNVPGDWNSRNNALLFYEGAIWCQHDFTVQLKKGKRYFLNFGAVNYEAYVAVNGKKAGQHQGGFTPFEFEVTDLLHDGNNSVVVKVNNTRKKENVPTTNFDWWNYGGITRDVVLAEMPATYIQDYKIQLAKADLKTLQCQVQLAGNKAGQQVEVRIPEAGLQLKFGTDSSGRGTLSVPLKNLTYWSPENPKLYDVRISTSMDTVDDEIGFRTIETKGTNILLNGKPLFLRGICLHEENPLIPGRPRSKADLKMLLGWAKELNCNFVRLAHYPHNEYMSRLADEMGLLLWEEVPVYWTIDWENAATLAVAKQQMSELVTRDKNRASVIIWSIGNETPNIPAREVFMEAMADHAHGLDSTRLVSAALLAHNADSLTIEVNDKLGNKLDVVSFNEYLGWYSKQLPSQIGQFKFKIDFTKPVIITETGAGALAGFHADADTRFSEEFQEAVYQNQLKIISNISQLRGITPWILIDFRSPKRLHPTYQDYWNRKGLISETGKKKKAFYVLQQFYNEKAKEAK